MEKDKDGEPITDGLLMAWKAAQKGEQFEPDPRLHPSQRNLRPETGQQFKVLKRRPR